jgi:hypothetical protein
MRDCLAMPLAPRRLFWEAAAVTSNQLPGAPGERQRPPPSRRTAGALPGGGGRGWRGPDRITLKVHLQAIGDDVLSDLVASGDLDALCPRVARHELAGAAWSGRRRPWKATRDGLQALRHDGP